MPFWKPGSLQEEDNWRITAFLVRENGLWEDNVELGPSNAAEVIVYTTALTPVVTPTASEVQAGRGGVNTGWLILGGSLLALVLLIFVLKKSENTTTI